MNHFQTVPSLPGAQPLTIAGGRQPKNKKGKGRGGKVSGKGKGNVDEKSPQRSKRNRGDDELLQLDLKRKSHLLSQNVVPRQHYIVQLNVLPFSHLPAAYIHTHTHHCNTPEFTVMFCFVVCNSALPRDFAHPCSFSKSSNICLLGRAGPPVERAGG